MKNYKKLSADFVFTGEKVISKGIIVVDGIGKIIDIVDSTTLPYEIEDVSFYEGILCPGFVNCHCHLELSFLKNLIEPNKGLDFFIREVTKLRDIFEEVEKKISVKQAIEEAWKNGIVAIADITNEYRDYVQVNNVDVEIIQFYEIYGLKKETSTERFVKASKEIDLRHKKTIVPHSLYSVHPDIVKKIATFQRSKELPISFHFLEDPDEKIFFSEKKGSIVKRYEDWGLIESIKNFNINTNNEIDYLKSCFKKTDKLLLVHNIYITKEDIKLITDFFENVWWCICPISNKYIANVIAPVDKILKYSEKIVIGTDSLASNNSIDVFKELKEIKHNFPQIDTYDLLRFATINGAQCLGLKGLGVLRKNEKPGINIIRNLTLDFQIYEESFVEKII